MKGNRTIMRCLLSLIMLISCCMFFSACSNDYIESISVDSSSYVKNESGYYQIEIGKFDYSSFEVSLKRHSGEVKKVSLDESMISDNDQMKFFNEGEQTITVSDGKVKCELKIEVVRDQFSGLIFDPVSITYDGKSHSAKVSGNLPSSAIVSYPNGNEFINAGTYEVLAIVSCKDYLTMQLKTTLTIQKANYDMSSIIFSSKENEVYDGSEKSISISGTLPSGVSVSYNIKEDNESSTIHSGNVAINAGKYILTAHFSSNSLNYNLIDDKIATLFIKKADYDLTTISFVDKTYTYDNSAKSIEIAGQLPSGVSVSYSINGENTNSKIYAGKYTVIAKFSGDKNHNAIESKSAILTIQKANYDMSNIYFDSAIFVYDGTEKSIMISGTLAQGVSVKYYINGNETNSMTDVGVYEVTAKFSIVDNENYNQIEDKVAKLIIITSNGEA